MADAELEPPRRQRGWRVAARVLVAVALLTAILWRLDTSRMSVRWNAALAGTVAGVFVIQLVAQWLSTVRWRAILGPTAPPLGYMYRLYLVSNFFSLFLPTSIGGDAVRGAAIAATEVGPARGVVGVLLDRMFGVAALFGYFVIGALMADGAWHRVVSLPALPGSRGIVVAGVLLGLAALAAIVAWRAAERVRRGLAAAGEMVRALLRDRPRLSRVVGASFLVQGTYIVAWLVLASAFPFVFPRSLLLVWVPLVSLGAMLPVTVAGLGVREGAWVLLLSAFGADRGDVVVFSLLYFLAFVLVGLVGGILFLMHGIGRDVRPTAARAS